MSNNSNNANHLENIKVLGTFRKYFTNIVDRMKNNNYNHSESIINFEIVKIKEYLKCNNLEHHNVVSILDMKCNEYKWVID